MKLQDLEKFYRWHSKIYDLTRPLFLGKRLTGRLKFLAPFLTGWLKLHGLHPDMPLYPLLQKYFRNVTIRSLGGGYRVIALAEFPIPQPVLIPPPARPFRVVAQRIIFSSVGQNPILSFDIASNKIE